MVDIDLLQKVETIFKEEPHAIGRNKYLLVVDYGTVKMEHYRPANDHKLVIEGLQQQLQDLQFDYENLDSINDTLNSKLADKDRELKQLQAHIEALEQGL